MKAKIYLLSLLAVFFSSCDGYFSGMDIKNEYTLSPKAFDTS